MSKKTGEPRPTVFISYSHKDGAWLQELRTMLAPLVGNKVVDVWYRRRIQRGNEAYSIKKLGAFGSEPPATPEGLARCRV